MSSIIMKNLLWNIQWLACFHVVGFSLTAAFKPVINMKQEAIIGGFKCLYWPLKHEIAHQLTFNTDLMQGSLEPL